jgi:hypothetical protein
MENPDLSYSPPQRGPVRRAAKQKSSAMCSWCATVRLHHSPTLFSHENMTIMASKRSF